MNKLHRIAAAKTAGTQLSALKTHHKLHEANLTTLELLSESSEEIKALKAELKELRESQKGSVSPRTEAKNREERRLMIEENTSLRKQIAESVITARDSARRLHDTRVHLQGLESGRALAIDEAKEAVHGQYRQQMMNMRLEHDAEVDRLTAHTAEITQQFKSLQLTERGLRDELARIRADLSSQMDMSGDSAVKVSTLKAEIQRLNNVLTSMEAERREQAETEAELDTAQSRVAELEAASESYKNKISSLQKEIADRQHEEKLSTARVKVVRGASSKGRTLPRTESGVLAQLSAQRLKAEIDSLKLREARLVEDVRHGEARIAALDRSVGTLRARLCGLDEENKELKEGIERARDRKAREGAESDRLRTDVKRLTEEVARLSSSKQFTTHVELKRRLRGALEEVDRLRGVVEGGGRKGRTGPLLGATVR